MKAPLWSLKDEIDELPRERQSDTLTSSSSRERLLSSELLSLGSGDAGAPGATETRACRKVARPRGGGAPAPPPADAEKLDDESAAPLRARTVTKSSAEKDSGGEGAESGSRREKTNEDVSALMQLEEKRRRRERGLLQAAAGKKEHLRTKCVTAQNTESRHEGGGKKNRRVPIEAP